MEKDPRDILWDDTYNLYYDTYFNELLTLTLTDRWSFIDRAQKVLIAIMAFITVVLGMFAWNEPAGKFFWFSSSLAVLILTVVYIAMNGTGKMRKQLKSNKEFWGLRIAIESLRDDMDREQKFDIETHRNQLAIYEFTFNEICKNNHIDNPVKSNISRNVQNELNKRLSGAIQKGSDRLGPGKRVAFGINRAAPHAKPRPRSRQFKYSAPKH